jgi:hypothetical protein
MYCLPIIFKDPPYLEKESSDEEALTLAVSDLAVVHAVRFADPETALRFWILAGSEFFRLSDQVESRAYPTV